MTLNSLEKYGYHFQVKVISCLLTSREFLIDTIDLLHDDYFNNQAHQWIIQEIIKYFSKYHTTVSIDILKIELKKIENNVLQELIKEKLIEAYKSSEEDLAYVKEEFTNFLKNQKLKQAIESSIDYLKKGDFNTIRTLIIDAVKAGESKNIGHDYSKDTETRYRDEERNPIPFPWPEFNEITQGGYGAGDLVLIFGNPGGSKSWTLAAMAAHAASLGKNVIYYTLELSDIYVGKRIDSIISGIAVEELKNNRKFLEECIDKLPGKIIIKEYPPRKASISTIENHLERLEHQNNFIPDAIFIDYLDYVKNRSRRKEKKDDIDDVYIAAKGLAKERRIPIVSPSQVNRMGAKDDIIEGDKAAGSYDKTMIGDISISLSRKRKDKINNVGRFFFMKNRYGPDGMTFIADIDPSRGYIKIKNKVLEEEDEYDNGNNNISNNYNHIPSEDKKVLSKELLNFFKQQ